MAFAEALAAGRLGDEGRDGFKETAARHALRRVATHVGTSVEDLVRGALALLT